jgi:hypothetical protein
LPQKKYRTCPILLLNFCPFSDTVHAFTIRGAVPRQSGTPFHEEDAMGRRRSNPKPDEFRDADCRAARPGESAEAWDEADDDDALDPSAPDDIWDVFCAEDDEESQPEYGDFWLDYEEEDEI